MIFIIQRIINTLTRQRYTRRDRYEVVRALLHHTRQSRAESYPKNFYDDLRKTVSWTESIIATIKDTDSIDYSRIFRSTNPLYEGKPFYTFDEDGIAMPPAIPFSYVAVLPEAMKVRPDPDLLPEEIRDPGKILRFEIDLTTHDGAPFTESDGFVDWADIPPIDTWFCVTIQYLYCWIPGLFIDKMQRAIDVEVYGSYDWIELENV